MAMVTAQLATIPDRENILIHVINSLIPQVNKLNVMLNGWTYTPPVTNKKLTFYHLNNSKGDAVKFYRLRDVHGYVFSCDDDLVYPPDYTRVMIEKLQQYNNEVILTNHGRIMNEKPVKNSYTDRKEAFHCLKQVDQEVYLDIGGTGAMAWHSDAFFPNYDRINKKNMADIWVAKFASEQDVKILLNPHSEGWIKYLHPKLTIWDEAYFKPEKQTALYNSF